MVLYKHENNKDVAFELIKVQYEDDLRLKLKVKWWNISSPGYEYPIIGQKITISKSDWSNKWNILEIDTSNLHWGA